MTQTHAALERAAQKLADKYLNDFSPEGDGKRPNAFALDVVQIVAAALAQEAAGDGSEIADSRFPGVPYGGYGSAKAAVLAADANAAGMRHMVGALRKVMDEAHAGLSQELAEHYPAGCGVWSVTVGGQTLYATRREDAEIFAAKHGGTVVGPAGDGVKESDGAPSAWREVEIVRLINLLRSKEGDSVTLLCDNPDFNGQPNCAVICNGEWTGWQDRRFAQDTILDALSAAMIEYLRPSEPTPDMGAVAVPVAWRWRFSGEDETKWCVRKSKPPHADYPDVECQPLYASPASPPAVVPGREAIANELIRHGEFSSKITLNYERALIAADAILALYPAPTFRDGVEADGWRDIASAPKDGSQVDLVMLNRADGRQCRVPDAYWDNETSDWCAGSDCEPAANHPKWRITHWARKQPFPTPPVTAGSESASGPQTCLDDTGLKITSQLYKAVNELGNVSPCLLAMIGSWGDTLDDPDILEGLKTYNEMGECFSPAASVDLSSPPAGAERDDG